MRELFASLLFGWVAKSRFGGQINGYLDRLCDLDRTRLTGSLFLFSPHLRLLSLLIVLFAATGFTQKIDTISFTGNKITKESTLLRITRTKTGTIYNDSVKNSIKRKFLFSGLFDTTTITTSPLTDSTIQLNIDVLEKKQFYISDLGGGIYGTRYGEPTDFPWLKINLGATYRNIGGTGQKLKLYGAGWRNRYIGAIWEVPLPRNYFFETGAAIGSYPSLYDQWHAHNDFRSTIGIGKEITLNQVIKLNIMPRHTDYELRTENTYDKFWEITSTLRWKTDLRDRRYNPRKGFYFEQTLSSNFLLPYKNLITHEEETYFGGITDVRGYFSPWEKDFTFALQMKADLIYSGCVNRYQRHYMGGSETLRGFAAGTFGTETIFNNTAVTTAEFRFPMFSIEGVNLSFLSWYHKSLRKFPFDINGAVFMSGGYLWESIENIFNREGLYHTAASAGTGIRLLFPTLQMSGCIDFSWPIYAPEEQYDWIPMFHGYINLPF